MTNAEAVPTPPTQELPLQPARFAPPASLGAQGRYRVLAAAVRRHELVTSHPAVPKRPIDHALYAALAEVDTPPAGNPQR